jgi:hypothetical protein
MDLIEYHFAPCHQADYVGPTVANEPKLVEHLVTRAQGENKETLEKKALKPTSGPLTQDSEARRC